MSYDIRITAKNDQFEQYLLGRDAKKEDGYYSVTSEHPYLYFEYYSEEGIRINYMRNHYNVIFTYRLLKEALEDIEGFSFEDLQFGKNFSAENSQEINDEFFMEIAQLYAQTTSRAIKVVESQDVEMLDQGRIPMDYKTLHRITDDLYLKDFYYDYLEGKGIYSYIPGCLLLVNQPEKTYIALYTWAEFVDILFPSQVKIDYLMLMKNVEDPQNQQTYIVKFDELQTRLPQPESLEIPGMGLRTHYFGLESKGPELFEEFKDLAVDLPKGFSMDLDLVSPYSVV